MQVICLCSDSHFSNLCLFLFLFTFNYNVCGSDSVCLCMRTPASAAIHLYFYENVKIHSILYGHFFLKIIQFSGMLFLFLYIKNFMAWVQVIWGTISPTGIGPSHLCQQRRHAEGPISPIILAGEVQEESLLLSCSCYLGHLHPPTPDVRWPQPSYPFVKA